MIIPVIKTANGKQAPNSILGRLTFPYNTIVPAFTPRIDLFFCAGYKLNNNWEFNTLHESNNK
jgi:hypothetical protein